MKITKIKRGLVPHNLKTFGKASRILTNFKLF